MEENSQNTAVIKMENRVAKRFINKVKEIMPEAERSLIFDALKRYHSSMDLKHLIRDLRDVLNEPNKLEIYEFVRPLIPPKHQLEYDKLTPTTPGQKSRSITLYRRGNESFGFAVRGGFEHGIGVFVSQVTPGSQAEHKGLRVGDEIIRVNGFTISEAIHEEVLNLMKGRDEIELKVTNIGMLPIKANVGDPVSWSYVGKQDQRRSSEKKGGSQSKQKVQSGNTEDVKLFVNLRSAPSLGCSIVSGPDYFPGIFIERIRPGSLGEEIGMEVGDQIIDVNGTKFMGISHNEAVVALKGSKELNIVMRKRVGVPLFQKSDDSTVQSKGRQPGPSTPTNSPQRHDRHADDEITVLPGSPPAPPTPPHSRDRQDYILVDTLADEEENNVQNEQELIEAELQRQESMREKVLRDGEKKSVDLQRQVEERERREEESMRQKEQERKATERLQKVVEQKLERQRWEAEKLRLQMFEENRIKRQSMEKELMRKVSQNHRAGEKTSLIRLQRQEQEQEEMIREGAMSGLVSSIINMWRPHRTPLQKVTQQVGPEPSHQNNVLAGRGEPLKSPSLSLLGPPSDSEEPIYSKISKPEGPSKSNLPVPEEQMAFGNLNPITPISDMDDFIAQEVRITESVPGRKITYIDSVISCTSYLPATMID